MKTVRINTLLAVSILLTIASALITHYAARESGERVDIVVKTEDLIRYSEAIISQLKSSEIHYRDYLLLHDANQLEKFHQAAGEIESRLIQLKALIADSAQIDFFEANIAPVVKEQLTTLTTSINGDPAVSSSELTARRYITYSEGLSEKIKQFTNREETLLQARMTVLQDALSAQRTIRYICFILIGITSFLALISLNRKQRHNDELILQLNKTNETLEDKIKERTLELERKKELAEKLNRDLNENFQTLELFYEALQVKNLKTQDTLREIQYLYDNANCGYHSLNPDGKIIRINQTELNWLGYKRHEVIGKLTLKDIIIPEEHTVFEEKFSQFLRERNLRNMKYHYRRKDGSSFPVLLNATAIFDKEDNFVMSRSMIVDITDQEEAQKQLMIVNQRLKTLNEEKNSFLGAAAHDLKSPLNGILGLIHLFRKKNENLTIEQSEYLRYIEQSCSRMKVMVTNLLDINRIEQGHDNLSVARFSLRDLVTQQMQMFKEASDRKNISIILNDHEDEIFMNSDPAMIGRITDNLISNALKFSFPEGSIYVTLNQQHERVRIEVKDNGPGIPNDELPLLFNKFRKLSPRPTGGESSTGLGLSIVKEIVHLLQGGINVASEQNVGTTFVVELPMHINTAQRRERSEV